MNKMQLIESCSQKCNLTKKQVSDVLVSLKSTIVDSLKCGQNVQICGVGKFYIRVLPPRTILNNITKKENIIPQRFVVCFKSSKNLSKQIK